MSAAHERARLHAPAPSLTMARVVRMETVALYLCGRCLLAGDEPGPCPRCGRQRLTCRPGDADDPCRRPLIDAAGVVRTRAPLWWLTQTVGPLMRHIDPVPKPGR